MKPKKVLKRLFTPSKSENESESDSEKAQRTSEKNQRINGKHQRKFSLSRSISFGVSTA